MRNAPLKITHIVPAFTRGGAERVVIELANHAFRSGHDVRVVAAYPIDGAAMVEGLHPDIPLKFILNSRGRLRPYAALLPWLIRNRSWLLAQDIVHCHLTFAAVLGTAVQALRRFSGKRRPRVVETFHAVGMPIPRSRRVLSAMLARGRDAYALMAEDDFWRSFAAENPDLPLRIIPNGITPLVDRPTPEEARVYRAEFGIPDDALVVGTVGRILAERKPLEFPPIFAEVAREVGAGVHFYMGGDGPMREETRAAADSLGLAGRAHFPGMVTRPGLAFAILDLYISINVGPITGIAALEAAASGLPVISIQVRPDYCAGPDDWIWSSSDPAEVAAEAIRLLKSPRDRADLAARQQRHVESVLSADAMARAYEALYRSMLETAGG